jgi:hypothetical protein
MSGKSNKKASSVSLESEGDVLENRKEMTHDDELWVEKFQELQAFHKAHGHIPNVDEHELLFWWMTSQQQALQIAGKLPRNRETLLNELDSNWSKPSTKPSAKPNDEPSGGEEETHNDKRWKIMYNELVAFIKENKHMMVPANVEEYKKLYNWIKKQRQQKKEKTLKAKREERLKAIGFVWVVKSVEPSKSKDTESLSSSEPARKTKTRSAKSKVEQSSLSERRELAQDKVARFKDAPAEDTSDVSRSGKGSVSEEESTGSAETESVISDKHDSEPLEVQNVIERRERPKDKSKPLPDLIEMDATAHARSTKRSASDEGP